MTPTPLDKIRLFSWQDHKSALWWLGLLYRRPKQFREALEKLSLKISIVTCFQLWLHFLPYFIVLSILGRVLLFGIFGVETVKEFNGTIAILTYHIGEIFFGILGGFLAIIVGGISCGMTFAFLRLIASGIVEGINKGINEGLSEGKFYSIFGGTILGIVIGISVGIIGVRKGIHFGIIEGIIFGMAVGIVSGSLIREVLSSNERSVWEIIAEIILGISTGISLKITAEYFGIASGSVVGLTGGIASILTIFRLYYYPIHLFFVWSRLFAHRYSYHPVSWDDLCVVSFRGLYRLLVAYTEQSGEAGYWEIERLINEYPSQRVQALRAKTILLTREASKVRELSQLDSIVTKLPEGEKGFLREVPKLQEMVGEISALQMRLDTIDRPVLREPYAQSLYEKIENFYHRIAGFREPLRSEFRKAADNWLQIARQQWEQIRAITCKEPTPQIFRAGDPVNRESEAFVPRYSVIGELEKQVMLSTGCPGLVVYARRRMGKSTLLRNLNGFIPGSFYTVVTSMQNPQLSTSLELWITTIREEILNSLHGIGAFVKKPDLETFFSFLSGCNQWLEEKNEHILLAIDEYENIDLKIGEKVFPEDLLATIRESIQSHRRVTWIFAGSHEISELKNAPWTSYLVSARTLEVPMFTPEETRLLLTEPLKYSTLWAKDDPKRPRFAPEFWGDGGIERVHREAGGWPHLVQLIAETIVDLMNDEDTREVNAALLERALDKAIVSGHNVLYELVRRECALPGEWEYLSAFRKSEFQPPPEDEAIHRSLRRRLLVAEENGRWRLRVPLMLRWLRQRG